MQQATEDMAYNLHEPIDTIFTAVDRYVDLTTLAHSPVSNCQCFDIGYLTFKQSGIFGKYLTAWDNHQPNMKTWPQMQIDFCKAVKELWQSGELHQKQFSAHWIAAIVAGVESRMADH